MTAPLSRSSNEAHLFLDLHPCDCGGPDAKRASELFQDGPDWFCRYRCVCASCGRERTVVFRQPAHPTLPPDGEWAVGTEPSELLDAGEWLLVADLEFGDDPDEEQDIRAAAAAFGEALKFLPPGAAELPAEAVWTERGRAIRQDQPERFSRARLELERDRCLRLVRGSGVVPADQIRARTLAEAHQYVDLAFCVCGACRLPIDLPAEAPRPDGTARVEFRCPRCDRTRRYDFRLDELPTPGAETDFGPGRSELIDPGQWLVAVADKQAAAVTQLVDDAGGLSQLSPQLVGLVLRSLVLAGAAGDQALRFLPDDAARVPIEAFHSDQGRYAALEVPELFTRDVLTGYVVGYRRRLAEAVAVFEQELGYTAEQLDELAGAPLPYGVRPGEPRPARTRAEASLATLWLTCRCGAVQTLPFAAEAEVDGRLVITLYDSCDVCGRRRAARFVNAADQSAGLSGADALAADGGRSALFDAGLFLATARRYTESAMTSLAAKSQLDSWHRIRHQLLRAAQAVDEAATFLPRHGDAVPAEALWTDPGRQLYEQEPELFTRAALDRLRAEAWQRYERFLAEDPEPETDDDLPARSPAERELYLLLHPCRCGAAEIGDGLPRVLDATADHPVFRYEGRCVGCGRERRFDFVGTGDPLPELDHWAAGDRPSELVDAGEWLAVAAGYGADADAAAVARGLGTPAAARLFEAYDFDPAETAAQGAVRAAAAIDEVLKFLPAGATELPADAVWTPAGREIRAAFGDRFGRSWLETERDRCWRRADELADPAR